MAEVRIYEITEGDWWAGYDYQSCVESWRATCWPDPVEEEDLLDEGSSEPLDEAEMERLRFTDEDAGETRTFRAELERRIAAGVTFPELFASTEW